MRQVGTRFDILRNPREARCRIAGGYGVYDGGHVVGIERPQHVAGHVHRHGAVAKGDQLLKRGQRVAHSALGPMRDQIERVPFELHAFCHAHSAKPRHDFLVGKAMEVKTLATRMDGFRHFLRIGGAQDEHHVVRRLFQRFEQRVERRRGQHVHLVDDIDLVATARRGVLNAPDDFLAHVFHAGTTCGVHLVHIGMRALGDRQTLLARAVGRRRGPLLAQKRLGQKTRRGGFSRAARAAEQIRVTHLVRLDGVFKRTLNMGLANHVLKRLRTVFPIQSL